MDHSFYDRRKYPIVDVREGYGEWARTYEQTVLDEMDIRLLDVVTSADGAPIAGGFMSFHKGSFPWTLDYDEIEYVLEGELHIGTPQETTIGLPGDVLYVPKGTHITFGTPDWVKFFYVTYPAEWRG